jgi:hypothetical protein
LEKALVGESTEKSPNGNDLSGIEVDAGLPDGGSAGRTGTSVDTHGGAYIEGDVTTGGGDFIGRDQINITGPVTIVTADPQVVGNGLKALGALIVQSTAVRAAAIAYRTDFQAASEQINKLGQYKSLHDVLHRLQFDCFNLILQEVDRFPNDDQAIDNLAYYQITFDHIVEELRSMARESEIVRREISWIKDLVDAQFAYDEALKNADQDRLKTAVWLLNRLLATQPSQINTSLNNSARALRLPALSAGLIMIKRTLESADLDPDMKSEFLEGVNAIDQLNANLVGLVNEHDDWQEIDLELRWLETNMDNLAMSWPYLHKKIAPLYEGVDIQWAIRLTEAIAILAAAMDANNPSRVRLAFRSFRARANIRFYQVDMALKKLSDELQLVGTNLASILRLFP